ncbi:MAG: RNA 2',3'-cyclic phosphodiesterase [Alteromonadaceae bacterium]|nr:RNA 2',3'-cyclic phosphodiesterase [Alteromonadaceae bacterium]
MNRLFFALDIPDTDKQKLANWRHLHLNFPFKCVPHANFHVTLAFLGTISKEQQKILMSEASQIAGQLRAKTKREIKPQIKKVQPKVLSFDHCELFKKPKVLFLGINASPQWLKLLAGELSACAKNIGLFQESRPFRPHISMYRKASGQQLTPLKKKLTIEISSFSLYQSISTESSVCYQPVKTWPID